jgi:hypothetical protein
MKLVTVEDFLDRETCAMLVAHAEQTDAWEESPSHEFWNKRILRIANTHATLSGKIAQRVAAEIEARYECGPVWCDTLDLIRWPVGWKQDVHDDQANGFEYRDFGSVIYLNDNYSGGHTHYPKQGVSIQPKVGMLAVHPGDDDHPHGVTMIEDAPRYTIASFWTTQKDRAWLARIVE